MAHAVAIEVVLSARSSGERYTARIAAKWRVAVWPFGRVGYGRAALMTAYHVAAEFVALHVGRRSHDAIGDMAALAWSAHSLAFAAALLIDFSSAEI